MQNQIKQNKLKLISLNFGESRKFEMFKSGEIYQNDLKVIEENGLILQENTFLNNWVTEINFYQVVIFHI